jgi:hypothetical protein
MHMHGAAACCSTAVVSVPQAGDEGTVDPEQQWGVVVVVCVGGGGGVRYALSRWDMARAWAVYDTY